MALIGQSSKKGWDIQNIKNATIQLQIGSPHPKEFWLIITLRNKSRLLKRNKVGTYIQNLQTQE